MGRRELQSLRALASDYGIQLAYRNALGHRTMATTDALFHTLRALEAPLERINEAEEVLQRRRGQRATRGLDRVIVAWNGHVPPIHLTLEPSHAGRFLSVSITGENGATVAWEHRFRNIHLQNRFKISGVNYCQYELKINKRLPLGYHTLTE